LVILELSIIYSLYFIVSSHSYDSGHKVWQAFRICCFFIHVSILDLFGIGLQFFFSIGLSWSNDLNYIFDMLIQDGSSIFFFNFVLSHLISWNLNFTIFFIFVTISFYKFPLIFLIYQFTVIKKIFYYLIKLQFFLFC
jgi:hypothetical protein